MGGRGQAGEVEAVGAEHGAVRKEHRVDEEAQQRRVLGESGPPPDAAWRSPPAHPTLDAGPGDPHALHGLVPGAQPLQREAAVEERRAEGLPEALGHASALLGGRRCDRDLPRQGLHELRVEGTEGRDEHVVVEAAVAGEDEQVQGLAPPRAGPQCGRDARHALGPVGQGLHPLHLEAPRLQRLEEARGHLVHAQGVAHGQHHARRALGVHGGAHEGLGALQRGRGKARIVRHGAMVAREPRA